MCTFYVGCFSSTAENLNELDKSPRSSLSKLNLKERSVEKYIRRGPRCLSVVFPYLSYTTAPSYLSRSIFSLWVAGTLVHPA
jgi:hypothetical protein